ncbi:alpha/beta-hydrolase [Fomitiporia mediterranea MF3/22]|uniref:alpha/beta-hydrolase n=1 Tax=Fomitiporia mediterranea (strain MF3/22) TaxID=694068 RepID=UPI0004407EF7|nr:alpha/beta-hydrolase [Fomitiporia mediterranea MF3/22]EJC98014.1 alpha/beta-hydrolase [Fomitiporia mediterranea MF3/22]
MPLQIGLGPCCDLAAVFGRSLLGIIGVALGYKSFHSSTIIYNPAMFSKPLVESMKSASNSNHARLQQKNYLRHFAVSFVLLVSIYQLYFQHWHLSGLFLLHARPALNNPKAGVAIDGLGNFNWTAHSPSKALNWTDCYNGFRCARLTVPLEYSDPSGEEAAIALIMSPSRYPPGHTNYRGPILFNPGGPGGSGIGFLILFEKALRAVLFDAFDLVSFDPRGVGFTTPGLNVFEDQVEAGKYYSQFTLDLNASASTLGEAYARARILSNLVADRARFVAERMSTPIVARDMLGIVNAFGQEKLQYWGFSYGTILGATFAAMFPDQVGRVVIDGVVDTEDYYSGLWANNLRDTDAALMDFYQACVTAGPSKCPIYENTTSLIQERIDRLLDKLQRVPLAFHDDTSSPLGSDFEVISHGLVREAIFNVLYKTHSAGATLAHALAALERGNTSQIYQLSRKFLYNSYLRCDCPLKPGETPIRFQGEYETTYAISCGDAIERNEDLEDTRKAYEEMAKNTSFAFTWPPRVFCSAWKLRAKEQFNGTIEPKTTSHPLLLISNTADNVTPLWNAHKMSKSFKDSVVLTQNSSGHCSISAASLCTFKAIRKYFINGTLPEYGTVCETESSIFGEKAFRLDALNAEDRELIEASRMFQENFFGPMFGGGFRHV